MRHSLFFLSLLLLSELLQSQSDVAMAGKPVVDSTAIARWVELADAHLAISPDGRYVTYRATNHQRRVNTLYVQSVEDNWQQSYAEATKLCFSGDSRLLVLQQKDSLCLLPLGGGVPRYVTGVQSVRMPEKGPGQWFGYQLKTGELYVLNLLTGQEHSYGMVTDYQFERKGRALLLQQRDKEGVLQVQWVNLADGSQQTVYSSANVSLGGAAFDAEGEQLSFTVQEKKQEQAVYSVWYYQRGMGKAVLKASDESRGIDTGLYIQPSVEFGEDGRYIYFKLQAAVQELKPRPGYVKVNIWNYRDSLLQSAQVLRKTSPNSYQAVVGTEPDARVVQVEQADELLYSRPVKGDFVVVRYTNFNQNGDRYWQPYVYKNWLVSLKDGSRRFLQLEGRWSLFYFSPEGRYVVCYDEKSAMYYSYEIATGKWVNISGGVPAESFLYTSEYDKIRAHRSVGMAGWLDGGGILVYDNYDIWLLDPSGRKRALNVTAGYGKAHHIKFRLATPGIQYAISVESPLLVIAYNTVTKYNGFYRVRPDGSSVPERLTMGPYTYCHVSGVLTDATDWQPGMYPLKASQGDVCVVKRQTYNEAPNYYVTRNFVEYRALTDVHPHMGYTWLSAELVHWKQLDGSPGQGILYKPENFDPRKKYPLLINYYGEFSSLIYEYPEPHWTGDAHINIPWFVSRGYLVFTPDIYFKEGELHGAGAYNSVVSGAQYLSKYPWVDSHRIGIAGHSFAGALTNYLVTHTNMFAAAFEGAGVSDFISSSLQLAGDGAVRLGDEAGRTLWQRQSVLVAHSPVLRAERVKTPLLMFHCKPDGAVPFEQAIELFASLRRLGKKVWLLQYDDGDHGVYGKNAIDLTKRVTQFFDYYLKGAPSPVWMSRGVPAYLKGINDGLMLDESAPPL